MTSSRRWSWRAGLVIALGAALAACSGGSGAGSGVGSGVSTGPAAGSTVHGPPRIGRSAQPTRTAGPKVIAGTAAAPARTACTGNRLPRYVLVSLRRQHMWMCARHRVAHDSPITSGIVGEYTSTPTGRFQIQGLDRDTTLTLNTGVTYPVKYWIPFQAPLFGFHDSPWQRFPYGSQAYRTRGSHGCVHMPLPAIRFLYRWADIGTTVRIKA